MLQEEPSKWGVWIAVVNKVSLFIAIVTIKSDYVATDSRKQHFFSHPTKLFCTTNLQYNSSV